MFTEKTNSKGMNQQWKIIHNHRPGLKNNDVQLFRYFSLHITERIFNCISENWFVGHQITDYQKSITLTEVSTKTTENRQVL